MVIEYTIAAVMVSAMWFLAVEDKIEGDTTYIIDETFSSEHVGEKTCSILHVHWTLFIDLKLKKTRVNHRGHFRYHFREGIPSSCHFCRKQHAGSADRK